MKIAHLAEAFGLNCEVHDSYNALNNVAARHVMMAIDNCDWLEVLAFTAPATTASTTSATA
jgi:L-alanine-DL-glutamate epimerase-like enolase superfamily enzyme